MFALKSPKTPGRRRLPRRFRNLACLPIKFTETTRVRFLDYPGATSTQIVTYGKGDVVTDLIVTDFDDFSVILEYRDGRIAYRVPKSSFIAKPNF